MHDRNTYSPQKHLGSLHQLHSQQGTLQWSHDLLQQQCAGESADRENLVLKLEVVPIFLRHWAIELKALLVIAEASGL